MSNSVGQLKEDKDEGSDKQQDYCFNLDHNCNMTCGDDCYKYAAIWDMYICDHDRNIPAAIFLTLTAIIVTYMWP